MDVIGGTQCRQRDEIETSRSEYREGTWRPNPLSVFGFHGVDMHAPEARASGGPNFVDHTQCKTVANSE